AGLLVAWSMLPRSRRALLASSLAALASAAVLGRLHLTAELWHNSLLRGGYTLVALMAAVLILRLMGPPVRFGTPLLESAPLVWTGRLSYGLYLYHMPIRLWLQPDGLGWGHPGPTLLVAGLAFAAAIASYFWLERPCLRLKDRLRPAVPAVPSRRPPHRRRRE